MPSASRTWFNSNSSVTIDFDLTTRLTLCFCAMSRTRRLASAAFSAKRTVAPLAVICRSNSTRSLSRLATAYCLIRSAACRHSWKYGIASVTFLLALAGALRDAAQRFPARSGLVESLGFVREEGGAVERDIVGRHDGVFNGPLSLRERVRVRAGVSRDSRHGKRARQGH